MILEDGNMGGYTSGNFFVIYIRNVIIGNAIGNIIGNIPRNIVKNVETGPSNITMHQTITLS
jgi:hypothetical protein